MWKNECVCVCVFTRDLLITSIHYWDFLNIFGLRNLNDCQTWLSHITWVKHIEAVQTQTPVWNSLTLGGIMTQNITSSLSQVLYYFFLFFVVWSKYQPNISLPHFHMHLKMIWSVFIALWSVHLNWTSSTSSLMLTSCLIQVCVLLFTYSDFLGFY